MLREQIKDALKEAMLAKDTKKISTLRLILAAVKERDIASRGTAKDGTISDDDILSLLQTMVKQRRESIELYQKGGREDLVAGERGEIDIIQSFMPRQMSADETNEAIRAVIAETGAAGMRDMGKVMAVLREKYAGQMDFGQASVAVKSALANA